MIILTKEQQEIIKNFETETGAGVLVKLYAEKELFEMSPGGEVTANEEPVVTVGWRKMIGDNWYGDWVQVHYEYFTTKLFKELLERFKTDQIANINQSLKIGERYADIIFPE